MEEIEGEEDEVVDVVSIKHCSKMTPDNPRRVIVRLEICLKECIRHRDWRKSNYGETQYS
jgi:hypothetical protein